MDLISQVNSEERDLEIFLYIIFEFNDGIIAYNGCFICESGN